MGEADRTARIARIEGRVQGVGYRYWVVGRARRLGLTGYVRNLTDGSVEALFIGAEADLARMLTFCEEGPPAALVSKVETRPPPPGQRLDIDEFMQIPNGAPGSAPKGP